jgi:exodeoxyribonuclease VII large subunit
LISVTRRLRISTSTQLVQKKRGLHLLQESMPVHARLGLERSRGRLARAELRLGLLDPSLVLRRGYAWLSDADGRAITSIRQAQAGQSIRATVADGTMELQVPAEI